MRRSFITLGIATLALAIAAPLALSQPAPGPDGQRGPGRRAARMAEALGLSQEQADALKTLRQAQFQERQAIRDQMKAKRQQMRTLWKSADPDRAQIVALVNEISALRTTQQLERVDFMFDVRGLLTPEQFGKFIEHAPGHMGRMGRKGRMGHMGRMGMRGAGPGMRGAGPGMRGDCPWADDSDTPAIDE